MSELTSTFGFAAIGHSRSPGVHRWALERGYVQQLVTNPFLGEEELSRLWEAKMPVDRRAALAFNYHGEAMGVRAVGHSSARVGQAWISNPASVITDAVLDAVVARKGKGTDKLVMAIVDRDVEAAGKLVSQLDVEVAKRAAVWFWAAFPDVVSDADVAAHLSTVSSWETSRSLHRLLSCLFARRPGLMGFAEQFSDSRVVTSMAGCRHVTDEAAKVAVARGEVFTHMALVANPCSPEWVVEAVKQRHLDEGRQVDGDLQWLLDFRAREANLPRVAHDTQDSAALARIVRRTLSKERVWDVEALLGNPAVDVEARKELNLVMVTGAAVEVSTCVNGPAVLRKRAAFQAERDAERRDDEAMMDRMNWDYVEQRLTEPMRNLDLSRFAVKIVQRVWDERNFSVSQWDTLLGLAPTWRGSAYELADLVQNLDSVSS